jgi:hypothetical protein
LFSIWQKPYRATKTLEILAWRIKMKISKYLVTPLAIAVILSASSSGVEAKKGGGKGRGGHSTLSGKRDAGGGKRHAGEKQGGKVKAQRHSADDVNEVEDGDDNSPEDKAAKEAAKAERKAAREAAKAARRAAREAAKAARSAAKEARKNPPVPTPTPEPTPSPEPSPSQEPAPEPNPVPHSNPIPIGHPVPAPVS